MVMRGLMALLPALALLSGPALAQGQTAQPPAASGQEDQTAQAAGDAAAGAKVFNQCKACHTMEEGKHRVGPSLHGVMGRKAGGAEGFKYSEAMKKAELEWTPENLSKYLADPKGFIPGNKMAFAGLKKEEDRQNVIAYLQQEGGAAKK